MPLECGIIFDGIPEGAISRKVGLIWGIPVSTSDQSTSIWYIGDMQRYFLISGYLDFVIVGLKGY